MNIGVTGTREGMNKVQYDKVELFLTRMFNKRGKDCSLHHGDCIGVDEQVATIAEQLGYNVISHPPVKNELRAFHPSHEIREPFNYLKRDRNIVDSCDLLIVVPRQNEWSEHGGTWYTHDYAVKKNKNLLIFFPNGKVDVSVK